MLKKFFSDKKAVSPVIGVMLMIVVTIILAGAVSSYSSSMDVQDTAPQATFKVSADESENVVTLEHLGGDIISKRNVKIEIASGSPTTTGYLNNTANVTFDPNPGFLSPGDIATISVAEAMNTTSYVDEPGWGITFSGDDISQSVYIGDSFRLTLIDVESGQTIYSNNVVVNP